MNAYVLSHNLNGEGQRLALMSAGIRAKPAQAGHVPDELFAQFYSRFQDPHYWTSTINFVAAWGRKPL